MKEIPKATLEAKAKQGPKPGRERDGEKGKHQRRGESGRAGRPIGSRPRGKRERNLSWDLVVRLPILSPDPDGPQWPRHGARPWPWSRAVAPPWRGSHRDPGAGGAGLGGVPSGSLARGPLAQRPASRSRPGWNVGSARLPAPLSHLAQSSRAEARSARVSPPALPLQPWPPHPRGPPS